MSVVEFGSEGVEEVARKKPALFRRRSILVADVPEGRRTIANIVGDHATVTGVECIDEALAQLGEVDLLLCGIHFDESRMFDLLRMTQAFRASRSCPALCFRDLESELHPTVLEGLGIACQALGALAFVDFYALKRMHGLRAADDAFLKMIFSGMKA